MHYAQPTDYDFQNLQLANEKTDSASTMFNNNNNNNNNNDNNNNNNNNNK